MSATLHHASAMFDRVGDLFADLGTPRFAASLYGFFDSMMPIDHCAVFVFQDGTPPRALAVEGDTRRLPAARELAREYVDGAFASDPIISGVGLAPGWRSHRALVSCFPASAIDDTPYRRRFYDDMRITEEINIFAEQAGIKYYACLFRNAAQPAFQPDEIDAVQFYSGMVLKALRRQFELSAPAEALHADPAALSKGRREHLLGQLRETLLRVERLSPREADVCAHIALGYTIVAISLNLGITINTVATHRKRAYAKLGISSQNELFARYIHSAIPGHAIAAA